MFTLILNLYKGFEVLFLEFFYLKYIIKFAKHNDFTTCVYYICSNFQSQFCRLYKINLSYIVNMYNAIIWVQNWCFCELWTFACKVSKLCLNIFSDHDILIRAQVFGTWISTCKPIIVIAYYKMSLRMKFLASTCCKGAHK